MDGVNWFPENYAIVSNSIISTIIILTGLMIWIKLYGLRSFAKFTPIDFAVTVCIGSVLSSTVMTDSNSIVKGVIVIGTLLLFQALFGFLRVYIQGFNRAVTNNPLYLLRDGNILEKNLISVQMTVDQLKSKVRGAGYGSFSDIKFIILESTGDISIITQNTTIDSEVFSDVRN